MILKLGCLIVVIVYNISFFIDNTDSYSVIFLIFKNPVLSGKQCLNIVDLRIFDCIAQKPCVSGKAVSHLPLKHLVENSDGQYGCKNYGYTHHNKHLNVDFLLHSKLFYLISYISYRFNMCTGFTEFMSQGLDVHIKSP